MARDIHKFLCRLALGSTLSLGSLPALAAEPPRAAQEAHIKVQDDDQAGQATVADADAPMPLEADEPAGRLDRDFETEVITERYPSRAVRIERHVAQDDEGNYFNHGPWSHWDENGVLKGSGEYRNGRRHGKWVRWFNAGEGKILSSALYKSFQAPFVAEAMFQDGTLHGAWTIYDTQGRLASEQQFEHGELHGKSVWYFPSGQKQREVDYQNGQIEGQLLEWVLEADAATKQLQKNGRPLVRQGEPEHKLVAKATYQNGRRQSAHVDYYSPGVKKAEGAYLFAKEVTKTSYDFWNGEVHTAVVGKEGVNQRHGKWTWWYKDGGKQLEGEFDADKPVGVHVWWHPNGQKQAEGEFDEGLETGKWIWWHANGQKLTEGQFAHGAQSGRWIRWNELGMVVESQDFDKTQLAEDRQPLPEEMEPTVPAPQRSTMRQPRPLKIESARRTPPTRSQLR
jgi:antitoxin component YwqK of YwqJK toxin-antitoxin module